MKNNGKLIAIRKEKIEKALQSTTRQYFIGNLKLPQLIEHIQDKAIEIGISAYHKKIPKLLTGILFKKHFSMFFQDEPFIQMWSLEKHMNIKRVIFTPFNQRFVIIK